jgi:hypothetical protein
MGRASKCEDADTEGRSVPGEDGQPEAQVRRRQRAASYLRAAKLTEDAAEREKLRRKAATLLSPRGRVEV